jgi:hypothetical protein
VRAAYAALETSLQRITHLVAHVDTELMLAPTAAIRERHETLLCGAVVVSTGNFEFFLHDLVRAFVASVCALGRPFATLPPPFQRTHYVDGSALLHRVMIRKAPWVADTREVLVARMHSVQAALPYDLFWEAFAATNSNPTSQCVDNILARCAVNKPWQTVSLKSIRKHSPNILRTALDALITLRNECAHTGKAVRVPTTGELGGYVELLADIGEGVTGALEDRLATL